MHISQFGFLSTGSWQIFAYPAVITAIKITCQYYLPLHLAVCDAIKYSAFRENFIKRGKICVKKHQKLILLHFHAKCCNMSEKLQ